MRRHHKNYLCIGIYLLGAVSISGCFDSTTELQAHIDNVKANSTARIEPMPEIPVFHHFDYSANSLRSPFVAPKPEAIIEEMKQLANCLAPDPKRNKQALEKFALDNLSMRGTLGDFGVLWALIGANDGTLHRVTIGQYLGLYNGRVTTVEQQQIKIVELIPDGAGCWIERETTLTLEQSEP